MKNKALIDTQLCAEKIKALKNDADFEEAITHSTSHTSMVVKRLQKARVFALSVQQKWGLSMHSIKINALHQEYNELIEFCRVHKQVTFEMYINDTYKRSLLLSAASYFETTISKAIYDFAGLRSHNNPEIVALVNNKAIQRQYHTLFDWDSNNANKFFRLFGEPFKQKARLQIKEKGLTDAEVAFITIGRERNILVH